MEQAVSGGLETLGMQGAQAMQGIQERVLRAYTVLLQLRPDWAGGLILQVGLGGAGEALSLAANVAGAVCLSLEPEAALLRNALRSGACDFVVNTLDEAIRAMKNEVRKGRPLCVGLEGDPASLLQQTIDRGLAPQVFVAAATPPQATRYFHTIGAQVVEFDAGPQWEDSAAGPQTMSAAVVLQGLLHAHPWRLGSFPFLSPADLRAFDTRAVELLTEDDRLRRRWLATASRIFPRERRRVLWITPEEEASLLQTASFP